MSARPSGSLALLATLCLAATAGAAIPGDVDQNCVVEAADTLFLSRAVMGQITLNPEQQKAADVAPIVGGVSVPDGSVTVADLVVLLRAVAGLQALPGGVNVPTLSSPSGDQAVNPITVTGTACPGDVVKLYVNGLVRGTAIAGADRSFVFPLVGIGYDTNTLKVTATAQGQTSGYSNQLTANNTGTSIATTNPPLSSNAVTVWPPPRGGGHYELTTANFIIPGGKTLILPPGTNVQFHTASGSAGAGLEVAGQLLVQGAPGGVVTLQKLGTSGQRWEGILITAGTGSLIDYAFITGANNPLTVTGSATSATLRGSEMYDFLQGVTASAGASVTVDGSFIHYASNSGTGIGITDANLTVTDSNLQNLANGISVSGSSFATIGPGNEFSGFRDAAIQITGPAGGIINGNNIDASAVPAQWGIRVINSSPQIRGNSIHGAETGILIGGSSNPLITDGNDIYGNIWGIWLEGNGDNDPATIGNPNPIITGNSIRQNSGPKPLGTTRDYCSSSGANLCISDYPPGSNAFIDARNNYWGNPNPGTIRNSIIDPDDILNSLSDPVAIDLSNFRASATGGPGSTPLFLYAMTGVSHSPQLMAPTLGDSLSVQFTLVTPADVTLRIYKENPPAVALRTISAPALGAGLHTIVWNGKDDGGNFVPDEAYAYVLTTTAAGFPDTYNPPASTTQTTAVSLAGIPPALITTTYNVYRNQPLKILFDMNVLVGVNDGRGRVTVNRTVSGSPVTLVSLAPFPYLFNQLFVYDGFDSNGNFLDATSALATFHFGHPVPMQRNAVIVERTKPLIAGPTYASARRDPVSPKPGPPAMPAIEVKGDPYLIRLSYDQLSRITFCIDQAAYLTVKILKQGRGNPDVPADVVATLLQDTATPHAALNCIVGGDSPYVVEWDGTEPGASDPSIVKPVADGSYTFTIEARNALQTNLRSLYRGIVQTRQ